MGCGISLPGRLAVTRLEKSMDNGALIRHRVLALFLPLAAVLYPGRPA
jgi:hypothetical protein